MENKNTIKREREREEKRRREREGEEEEKEEEEEKRNMAGLLGNFDSLVLLPTTHSA